jgi:hypothetical protein
VVAVVESVWFTLAAAELASLVSLASLASLVSRFRWQIC